MGKHHSQSGCRGRRGKMGTRGFTAFSVEGIIKEGKGGLRLSTWNNPSRLWDVTTASLSDTCPGVIRVGGCGLSVRA